MRTFAILLSIVFLLISCEKESGTELTKSENNQTSLKGAKPDIPSDNAVVFRWEGYTIWGIYDSKSNITVFVGFDVEKYCAAEPDFLDILNVQDLSLDELDESLRTIRLVNGEVTVTLFEGFWKNPCVAIGMLDPLYVGTAKYIRTDNDVIPDGPNFNSYGYTVVSDIVLISYRSVYDSENSEVILNNITLKVKL